ncbi:MAG: hypothetical protein IT328_20270 [Caldilineaceae bacterium]|nr:hypothetical protein [Caldilineaceae bacterium]
MAKPIGKNITMPESYWRRLQELANSNADTTRSRMLVILAKLAAALPEAFDIFPPSEKKGSHPGVDRRSTGERPVTRVNISILPSDWDVVQALANPNTKGYLSTLLRHLVLTAYENFEQFNLYPPSDVPIYRNDYTITQEMRSRLKRQNLQLDTSVFHQPEDGAESDTSQE